jgi:hypothetical protein
MTYVDDHPTHWDVLAPIERAAVECATRHGASWNTYWDHPPGMMLDQQSIDFWGPGGRGDPIGIFRGFAVWGWLFYDPRPPLIEWIIWQGWIWQRSSGWDWFSDDEPYADMGHFRHVHVTFEYVEDVGPL